MESNKKIKIIRLTIYSLVFLIPLLAMQNCSGWNEEVWKFQLV